MLQDQKRPEEGMTHERSKDTALVSTSNFKGRNMAVLLCPRDFADLCGVTVAEESLRAAQEPCTTATTAHVVLYDDHAFPIAVELQDIC